MGVLTLKRDGMRGQERSTWKWLDRVVGYVSSLQGDRETQYDEEDFNPGSIQPPAPP